MSEMEQPESWLLDGKAPPIPTDERAMSAIINQVICQYLGLPTRGPWRRPVRGALRLPVGRFAKLLVHFEDIALREGFRSAAAWLAARWNRPFEISGGSQIPKTGPVLIASNHPGTVDVLAIAASLPRDDFKAIARGYPFLKALQATSQHLIYTEHNAHVRMAAAREAIRHLRDGGVLLVFPSGDMDPDPSCVPGAKAMLDTWSSSLELLLRCVPEAQVYVATLSGFLAPECFRHPLARLRKTQLDRQIVAEIIQVIDHLLFNRRFSNQPRISYSPPFATSELADASGRVLPRLCQIAEEMLAAFPSLAAPA